MPGLRPRTHPGRTCSGPRSGSQRGFDRRRGLGRRSIQAEPSRQGPGSNPAARACTGVWGPQRPASVDPSSTTWPAYITATRVAHVPDDEQVVRDQQKREPDGALQLAEQLQVARLGGHVERGRRLIGDEHRGLPGERDRAGHALAHAAAELVRVLARAGPWPTGRCTCSRAIDHRAVEAWPRSCRCWMQRLTQAGCRIVKRRVERGHRVLHDHRDPPAAERCICVRRSCDRRSSPSSRISPGSTRAARGSRPMIARLVIVLPEPDSPTRPRVPPGAIRRLTSSTTAACPGPAADADGEVADPSDPDWRRTRSSVPTRWPS